MEPVTLSLGMIALIIFAGIAAIALIGGLLVVVCRFLVSCGILSGMADFSEQTVEPQEPGAWPPAPKSGE